ncbi:hypothetical protein, partial [Geomonas sp.]|uniref:hypothetical protein n=1 Tax=Geomonas sp. TaxID=2651584 RepID=UPI002B488DFB
NSCLALVPEDLDYSHLLWIESDLCFPPELLRRLLAHDVDVVAPMIWLGGLFYDTWGYRDIDGNPWTNHAPYHPDYVPMSLMEMGSVGSCVLFRRAILDAGVRYQGTYQNGLLVGMCHDARALGYRVFVDTSTAILHPVDNWEAQMWRPSQLVIIDSSGNAADMPLAEARGLGLEMHIAALDPNMMLQANGAFLRNLCWRYRSNRISVEVQARPYPRKLYRMQVHIGDPEPVFFKNPVTRLIPRGILRKKLQKELRTSLTIEIEESAEVG